MTLIQTHFFFGANFKNYEIGNGYLELNKTLKLKGGDFNNIVVGNVVETIRLVNKAFAYALSKATISTTRGEEIEQNKYVGHVSTIMRLLTS